MNKCEANITSARAQTSPRTHLLLSSQRLRGQASKHALTQPHFGIRGGRNLCHLLQHLINLSEEKGEQKSLETGKPKQNNTVSY